MYRIDESFPLFAPASPINQINMPNDRSCEEV